ncbi:MAG: virulence factor SrfB [Planctomycetales bacterium]|nr:virulence factor SrfB [Planctomycetales bacterium]
MHVVFVNTGVQIVCEPLKARVKAAIGHGWQRCEYLGTNGQPNSHHFLQWQLLGDRLLFAIDTTCGDPEKGFFCSANALAGDYAVSISQLLDRDSKPIPNLPKVEIVIRPASAGAGDAKPVHLVVDFGNSRTGALLIEPQGEAGRMPQMIPFELVNRFQLDLWDSAGKFRRKWSARWFNSRTQWCQSPYLPPPRLEKKIYPPGAAQAGGIFNRKKPQPVQTVFVTPRLFQELSPVRMGQEGDDVTQAMRLEADVRTGVSSPKRYLWADDATWLGGALWHMADPTDRAGTRNYSSILHGPFFRFLAEHDPDELELPPDDSDEIGDHDIARESPMRPQHAPRSLMVAALYEILCQAYAYVNSVGYREMAGETGRPRELRSLVFTFPSGMIPQERARFQQQAQKAIDIFHATLGRTQRMKPTLMMQVDEASAVHLTYIWSELQTLERNAPLWFSLVSRPRGEAGAASPSQEVRIGCIDIGGGTTDLMIAKYTHRAGFVDAISGEMLHRDGISLAGDQLVKRLLEKLIIPRLADCVGMSPDVVEFLFGQEVPANSRYRQQRVLWMNRMFVPLAQAYLQAAVNDDTQTEISHTDPHYVSPEIVTSLQQVIDEKYGGGNINILQDLALMFDSAAFEPIVFEVFNELLLDFCRRLVDYDVDIVLLAGQPTKLRQIQELVKQYLPLHSSRVIPLHNHFAGNWYPYQDDEGRNPGVIVDPKSAVVVGGAIDFLVSEGLLGSFQFKMEGIDTDDPTRGNDYFWGILTDGTSRIQKTKMLFEPTQPGQKVQRVERKEFEVVSERVLIGRRLSSQEQAEATPVWCLKVDKHGRAGPINLKVTLERKRATKDQPESFELIDVKGTVAGEPAYADEGPDRNVAFSWRTLTTDAFYLDTGALDNIDLSVRG